MKTNFSVESAAQRARKLLGVAAMGGLLTAGCSSEHTLGQQGPGKNSKTTVAQPNCALTITAAGAANGRELAFGPRYLHSESRLFVQVESTGAGDCNIGAPTLGSDVDPAAVSVTSDFALPGSLPAGQRLTLAVEFTPRDQKALDPAKSYFTVETGEPVSSECGASLTGCKKFSLTGLGILGWLGHAAPHEVDFGNVAVGCKSATRKVTFVAQGPEEVVSQVSSSPQFQVSGMPPLPHVMKAGERLTFEVAFAPTAEGPVGGSIQLTRKHLPNPVVVQLEGTGVSGASATEAFVQSAPKADLLFVVDDSGSMAPEQGGLSGAAQSLASALTPGHQVGVITTSVADGYNAPANAGWPGEWLEPGVLWGTPAILQSSTPDLAQTLAKSLKPGTNGQPIERAFEAAARALSVPNRFDFNAGFLRADANLGIVFVSDEDDDTSGSVAENAELLWALKGLTGPSDRLRVYPVVSTVAGAACGVGPGTRYQALQSLVGGFTKDLCTVTWGATLADIAADIARPNRHFFPSRAVDPSAPWTVKVDGMAVSSGQVQWDAAARAFTFAAAPSAGQTVEVSYTAACSP